MNPARTLPAMIAIGVFVVLLALGLVLWSQGWSRDATRARGLARCLAEVERRDARADARADLARGEDRPYFVGHQGIAFSLTADGIPGCEAGGAFADTRPYPFDTTHASDEPQPVCCDRDPEPNACGKVQAAYVRAYNAELARIDPRVVAKYCKRAGPGE